MDHSSPFRRVRPYGSQAINTANGTLHSPARSSPSASTAPSNITVPSASEHHLSCSVPGSPASSNDNILYIRVDAKERSLANLPSKTPVFEDMAQQSGEFWVTVPWSKISARLVEQPNLIVSFVNQLHNNPTMKNHVLRILASGKDQSYDPRSAPDFHLFDTSMSPSSAGPVPVSAMPSPFAQQQSQWSALGTFNTHSGIQNAYQPSTGSPASQPVTGVPWVGTPQSHRSSFSGNQNSDSTPPFTRQASSSSSTGAHTPQGNNLFNHFPSTLVAEPGTIAEDIVRQIETNAEQLEYIWSPVDASLYEVGNTRALQAATLPGAIKMVFPPHTMIMAYEKDGSTASPAFRPLHPHSNQWLKAQVCDHRCAYRAGTNSLKRPITIRDHFRKCVFLDEHHPLKVLCTLELAAHERASQGLLPQRRRTRMGSRPVKLESAPPAMAMPRNTRLAGRKEAAFLSEMESGDDSMSTAGASGSNSMSPNVSANGEDSGSDWTPSKAPRSLRGITSVSKGRKSPATSNIGQPPYLGHARRHTLPDARAGIAAAAAAKPNSNVGSEMISEAPSPFTPAFQNQSFFDQQLGNMGQDQNGFFTSLVGDFIPTTPSTALFPPLYQNSPMRPFFTFQPSTNDPTQTMKTDNLDLSSLLSSELSLQTSRNGTDIETSPFESSISSGGSPEFS